MVVHRMSEPPEEFTNLTFTEPGVPDFRASQDEGPAPEPTPPTKKRRLLPGAGPSMSGPTGQPRRPQREPKEKKPLPPIPRNGFVPDIERLYIAISLGVMPFDVELATKLTEIAHPAAEAWDELARKNEVVRRALVAILETGAWGKVLTAHAPLVALAWARTTGDSVRVTFAASTLGREAENHANRGANGGDDGNSYGSP